MTDKMSGDECDLKEELSVWCEECGVSNFGECFIHGGKMTIAQDNAPPPKAYLSLPKVLALKRAKEVDICSLEARRGVFAKKLIKSRTLFGPLEAVITPNKPQLPPGAMEYQLIVEGREPIYLDTSDENKCNWMMFVRPASTFYQQNTAAFVNNGQIFFVTCKNVPAGAELRVWYAAAYAKAIGKSNLTPVASDKLSILSNEGKDVPQDEVPACVLDAPNQKDNQEFPLESSAQKSEISATIPVSLASTNDKTPPVIPEKEMMTPSLPRDVSNVYTCSVCSMSFVRPRQLDSHVCKELEDTDEDGSVSGTKRRKGRPRKILENGDNEAFIQVLKVEGGVDQAMDLNLPRADIINYNDEDIDNAGDSPLPANDINTLPFSGLTVTGAESNGGNKQTKIAKGKRGPGRPKGSKNKACSVKAFNILKSKKENIKQQVLVCQFCEKSFTSEEQHLIHLASHSASSPFLCTFEGCNKSFANKFKYKRHKIVHEKPNNFQCKFCPSKFNRIDHLQNHLPVHDSNRKTFTCDTCGKSYLSKSTYMFHKARHEANEGEKLTCLVCSAIFKTKEELKEHVNTHNRYKREPEKPRKLSCPDCGKQFTALKDIRRHSVTHTGERPFLCEHCPQTFVRKDHLRRHYTSNHKKELYDMQLKANPYGCKACLIVFKKLEYLDYHNKTTHPNGIQEEENKSLNEKPAKSTPKNPNQNVTNSTSKLQTPVIKVIKPAVPNKMVQHLLIQKPLSNNTQGIQQQKFQQIQEKPDPRPQPTLLQAQPTEPQPVLPDTFSINVIKVQQPNQPVASFIYPATIQLTSASQPPAFDLEEPACVELGTTNIKTIPLHFSNQVLSQEQLQSLIKSQQQPDNHQQQLNQQQQQQQNQQEQQLLQQEQMQIIHQQLQNIQQESSAGVMSMPLQQLQLHQQFSLQPAQGIPQTVSIRDLQNTGNANFFIFHGQNFMGLQGLSLAEPVTVIKDACLYNKQPGQPMFQTQVKPDSVINPENSYVVKYNGQILKACLSKPDQCYTIDNTPLSQILSSSHQGKVGDLEKANEFKGQCISDAETTRIICQMGATGGNSFISSGGTNNMLTSDQGDLLRSHQQIQDDQIQLQQQAQAHQTQLQQQHAQIQQHQMRVQLQQHQLQQQQSQGQLQQQQSQGQLQQQQSQVHLQQQMQQQAQVQLQQQQQHAQVQPQPLLQQQVQLQQSDQQELTSFTLSWPDNFDFTPVGELSITADTGQVDNLGFSGHFLQQPTVLDQQQLQQLQLQNQHGSQLYTISTACTVADT